MYRLRAKRTTGSNPPAELLFGELAYSDANKRLYVGRADGSPCTFDSDLSLAPITEAIADLTTDLAILDSSQAAQDTAIASLTTTTNDQAAAINALDTIQSAQAAAIAETETTAQLNTRDTANRARENHTGTQPASTITGLATVATSGAYSDLSGRPAIPAGFTYDQQAEPVGPAVGATWRERSAGGLIVEVWQWDGTYWEKPATEFVSLFDWTTLSSTTGTYGNPMAVAYKLLGHRLNAALANSPQSGSDYWEFYGLNGGLIFDSRTLEGLTTNSVNTYVSMLATPSIHAAGDLPGSAIRALRIGSAGLIRRGHFMALYRRIRA